MAEQWCPEPAPERVGVLAVEPRCWCGFPLNRDGSCPFHGTPRTDSADREQAAA